MHTQVRTALRRSSHTQDTLTRARKCTIDLYELVNNEFTERLNNKETDGKLTIIIETYESIKVTIWDNFSYPLIIKISFLPKNL